MANMTTVMQSTSPRNNGLFTARSGQFNNGSLTLRSPEKPTDSLAKEFAFLRGEGGENPADLNNTVDVIDFRYNTARAEPRMRLGTEDDVIMGRSLADMSSVRQSG